MEYKVIKSKKRKRTIEFKVVDNEIIVYCPINLSNKKIEEYYKKHRESLIKQIKNNDIMTYLGRDYKIILQESPLLKKEFCEIVDDNFVIYKPKNKDINTLKVLKLWKTCQTKKIIPERIKYFLERYNYVFSFKKNKIAYRNQKSLWGSCSSKNNLNFNCKVIEKSIEVIDYLVVHELSHTLVKNHSKEFWEVVENVLPNYRELKKMLI